MTMAFNQIARRLVLDGTVQGTGVRPKIAVLARELSLDGFVRNTLSGVEVEVSGSAGAVDVFVQRLAKRFVGPTVEISVHQSSTNAKQAACFEIVESNEVGKDVSVPLDRVTCSACMNETFDPSNRRFLYPFTSCAECGPRYSIIRGMPYDRARTSMATFKMCEACQREYTDPADRRFHSQTNCCPICGPRLSTCSSGSDEPIEAAVSAIRGHGIVAIKGVGGYQLVCDASAHEAVARLRGLKCRPKKPMAVMVQSVEAAVSLVQASELELETLASAAGPIVLMRKNGSEGGVIADNVAPGVADLGLMLPTTPLHAILLWFLQRPLVVTSANVSGAPIEFEPGAVRDRFAGRVDFFLHHDREIVRPIDDSVVRCMAEKVATFRAGRGIAPIVIRRSEQVADHSVAAVGGQQKASMAFAGERQFVLGPHVGDVGTVDTCDRYEDQWKSLTRLFDRDPKTISHDTHPDYFTSGFARKKQVDPHGVQHHHAHVLASSVEHGLETSELVGFSMDGTGLGDDGTVWGGEILRVEGDQMQRLGSIRPFHVMGGDRAAMEPWRSAVAIACVTGNKQLIERALGLVPQHIDCKAVWRLQEKSVGIRTTSLGRLFDGVSALLLGVSTSSFEGEAAMQFESVCEPSKHGGYAFPLRDRNDLVEIDWVPMLDEFACDVESGVAPGVISSRFHLGLAEAFRCVAERYRELPVVFSGGVFQNRVLVEAVAESFRDYPSRVILPGLVPVNDGGLAMGQLVAAAIATRNTTCA